MISRSLWSCCGAVTQVVVMASSSLLPLSFFSLSLLPPPSSKPSQELFSFVNLTELDLSENDILFLPPAISRLSHLTSLNLGKNSKWVGERGEEGGGGRGGRESRGERLEGRRKKIRDLPLVSPWQELPHHHIQPLATHHMNFNTSSREC